MTRDKRVVGVNERGLRVGEDHQNARLTDYEVELLRTMHEHEGVGYRRLAKMFELSKRTVVRICKYQIRNQNPSRFRVVGTFPSRRGDASKVLPDEKYKEVEEVAKTAAVPPKVVAAYYGISPGYVRQIANGGGRIEDKGEVLRDVFYSPDFTTMEVGDYTKARLSRSKQRA